MDFRDNGTLVLKMETNEADQRMADLNRESNKLKATLKEIEQQTGRNNDQYRKTKAELDAVRKAQADLAKEIKNMDLGKMTYQQLTNHVKQLQKELKGTVPGSKEAESALKRLGETEAHLKKVSDQAAKIRQEASNLAKPGVWSNIKNYVTAAFAVISIQNIVMWLWNFAKAAIDVAGRYSDAFGDIQKTTGMTAEEVKDLSDEIKKIDTRTAQESLLDIAKVGGQIGIAKVEMLGFVESVDKAVVALGDEFTGGAEEVASKMGVLSKLFKETKDLEAGDAINQIGSAINELGAAGTATGPVVAEFTTRIGQLGNLSPQISETLGLGAAFQELGLTAEISAGGLSNILLTATKNTGDFAKQIGITEIEFKKLINSSPNDVVLKLAASFKGMPIDSVVKKMDSLGIKSQEATKVLTLLADKTDFVKEKQELAAKAMQEGTSLTNEFNIKNNTAAAQIEKLGKVVTNLKEDLGNVLLPAVLLVVTGFIGFINVLKAIPEFIRENKEVLIGLGIAIVTLNTANIAAAASALAHAAAEKGRAIATNTAAVATRALNLVTSANPIGIVIAAISILVGAFITWYNHSEKLRAGMAGLWEAIKTVGTVLSDFGKAALSLDFGKMADVISNGAKKVAEGFTKGYNEKLAADRLATIEEYDKTVQAKKGKAEKGAIDTSKMEQLLNQQTNDAKLQQDEEADEKSLKAKKAAANKKKKEEDKLLEETKKDQEKALEMLAQMEAEHDQAVAKTSLETEESKIREKQRKRLADIQASKADEVTKVKLIESINRNAEAGLEKVREEYRQKKLKADQEAKEKLLAQNNFIRDQERKAEQTLYDWQLSQAKNSVTKTAAIKKNHADRSLEIVQKQLKDEEAAEKAKATVTITDKTQLASALRLIEDRYNRESLLAAYSTSEEKKKIDQDLAAAKAKNLQDYSNMFRSLLRGDLSSFVDIAGQKVKGHKAAWQEKLGADMASYEQGAAMATQAVEFLNGLAQARADRAIAEIQRELREKMTALEADLAVTQSLMDASSAWVQDLKTNESSRLTELQQVLTSETASEEEKRNALKAYYSNNLQEMKAAEEQKIEDLQRMANLAKTEDEKRAIEEKIALAKRESEEKIRLADQEYKSKTETLDALTDFSAESSQNMLKDAEAYSEKQVALADEEATAKAELKQDLEETIAAENRKARTKEAAEKKKAWKAQQKADIATALVTGAIAVLKALANFFPLNIVLAAVAAVATGIQIARIKSQPEPDFSAAKGAVVPGSRHGSRYGDAGIALIDRISGQEVGEMEGGEAIVSVNQTNANWPLIQRMFQNARTPGLEKSPVMPLAGIPPAFRDGGRFESPYFERGMYLFGSKKKKAKAEAAKAEEEAKAAQAEADAAMGEFGADTSAYNGIDGTEPQPSTAESQAAHEAAQKQGMEQLEAIKEIAENTDATNEKLLMVLAKIGGGNTELAGLLTEIRNAVNHVEGAVNNSNQSSRLDQLISKISNMKAA